MTLKALRRDQNKYYALLAVACALLAVDGVVVLFGVAVGVKAGHLFYLRGFRPTPLGWLGACLALFLLASLPLRLGQWVIKQVDALFPDDTMGGRAIEAQDLRQDDGYY